MKLASENMSATAGEIIKCRAAVVWGASQPLSIEEIEVSPPKAHEVRVKNAATGICHSDVGIVKDLYKMGKFPCIPGHEGAGIVESIGEGVTKFQPGDHVILLYMPQCFECRACKSSHTNFCEKNPFFTNQGLMADGTTRFRCKGKDVFNIMGVSTFAEYTVVPDIGLCKINPKAPLNRACLIGCGVATGYGAALNTAKVEPNSICAVWGLGTVGLAAVMGCRNAGASKIYGIDINSDKFELAKKFGCTDFINPKDYGETPLQNVLLKLTNGGFDYTFECIGNTNTMKTALLSTFIGGTSVIIGGAPAGHNIEFSPGELLTGKTWNGSFYGGWKSVEDTPKLVEDYLNKKIMVDEFVTHTLPLEEINKGFKLLAEGKSVKTVIEF